MGFDQSIRILEGDRPVGQSLASATGNVTAPIDFQFATRLRLTGALAGAVTLIMDQLGLSADVATHPERTTFACYVVDNQSTGFNTTLKGVAANGSATGTGAVSTAGKIGYFCWNGVDFIKIAESS